MMLLAMLSLWLISDLESSEEESMNELGHRISILKLDVKEDMMQLNLNLQKQLSDMRKQIMLLKGDIKL